MMSEKPLIPEVLEPDHQLPRDLRALKHFAILMDEAVRIPGTRKKVGLDAAVGLIPGVGDVVAALMSTWIIFGAIRHRVPFRKVMRMTANVIIDLAIGAIPVAGDVFDFLFKENISNVQILLKHRNRHLPPRRPLVIGAAVALVLACVLLVAIAILMFLTIGVIRFARGL